MPRRDSSSESDRGSHRRRRDRKRNSSSPDSRGNSESSSDRIKRKTHHSRSRSGSRSRTSRRRSRSRSLSSRSPKRHARRSRSSSRSRRRSRSGSRSRRRRSTSGSRSRAKSYRNKNTTEVPKGGDILKQKVQQAIKAAANASAELREKGLLSDVTPSTTTTISDQLKRAQAIDDINAQSFVQQEFISSRQANKTITPKSEDTFDKDSHMSAIFGLAAPKLGLNANSADASIKKLESWKENPEMLVHESLFVDQTGKQERWLKKLFMMRKKQITSNDDI